MNSCEFNLSGVKVLKELATIVGTETEALNHAYSAFDGNNYDSAFVRWYNDKYDTIPVDFATTNDEEAKILADRIEEYYKTTPNVGTNTRPFKGSDKVSKKGYPTVMDREEGIRHAAGIVLDIFKQVSTNNIEVPKDSRSYYLNELIHEWTLLIVRKIAEIKYPNSVNTDEAFERAKEEYNNELDKIDDGTSEYDTYFNYIDAALGGENKDIISKNLLAVYKELNDPKEALAYFNEVLWDKKLQFLKSKEEDTEDDILEKLKAQQVYATSDVEITTVDDADDVDRSIAQYGSHQGLYSSFTMHLGEKLTIYFNTLDKYMQTERINGVQVPDRNNRFGIPDKMDASAVLSMLYSINSEFTTTADMIESIKRVARTIDEFACFAKLAEDLEQDPDLATELRTVIAKTVIAKLQVKLQHNDGLTQVTNQRADRRATMLFNLLNDSRKTLPNADATLMEVLTKELDTELAKYKDSASNEDYEKVLGKTIDLFTMFYPSVQPAAIQAFADCHDNAYKKGNPNKIANLKMLFDIIKNTNAQLNEIKQGAIAKRNAWKKAIAEGQKAGRIPSVRTDDFLNKKQKQNCVDVISLLMPYSVIRLQLNHPNALGNNASDVINNSYITRLKKLFANTYTDADGNLRNDALEAWGRERLKSKQFKYSSILLARSFVDKSGNVQNISGIFKIVNNQLYLTNDAQSLLEFYLFDGSQNLDKGKNAPYSEMGEGGYLPTAFMAYFRPVNLIDNKANRANYFCRTPSDAPKNFLIQGIKYDIRGLLTPSTDPQDYINEITDNITILDDDYLKYIGEKGKAAKKTASYTPLYSGSFTEDQIRNSTLKVIASGIFNKTMPLNDAETYESDGEYTYLRVLVKGGIVEKIKEGNKTYKYYEKDKIYLFRGKLSETTEHKKYLADAELIGFRNGGNGTENLEHIHADLKDIVSNKFKELIRYKDVELNGRVYPKTRYKCNRDHYVFKLLKNAFKQELLNTAIAIDTYFETDAQGYVKDSGERDDRKTVKVKNEELERRGYNFYHLNRKGKVLDVDENGEYTLDGGVFHSNRFVLSVEKTNEDGEVEVVEENYLDKLIGIGYSDAVESNNGKGKPFQLLYGADMTQDPEGAYLHVVKRDGVNKDTMALGDDNPSQATGKSNSDIIDIKLTRKQEAAVDDAIDDFVSEYVDQAFNIVSAKRNFIGSEVKVDEDSVADFAINYFLHFVRCDDLFEGDTKFYLDGQTILKRAKEIQGSGVPYGISNYLDEGSEIEDYEEGYLTKNAATIFKGTSLENLTQRTKFYGITIANTKMTNTEALTRIEDQLVAQLYDDAYERLNLRGESLKKKDQLNRELVQELLYGPVQRDKDGKIITDENGEPVRRGGFTEQKVNDAQSYITFEEFVRRIANKGQLKNYETLIKKLLNDRYIIKEEYIEKGKKQESISREEYKRLDKETQKKYREEEPLTSRDLKAFVQLQKNFYYDMWFDEEFGLYVPRQIKNAEFVLVPRLIEGTELEQVYNMMKEAEVDQLNTVETSKAANKNILTLWDNNGIFHPEGFVKAASDTNNKMLYDYKYLYTQQETPQHVNSENKAAIQLVKKIIDNIPPGHPLEHKKAEYFNIMAYNVRASFDNLMKEFGISLVDGDIPANLEKKDINFKAFAEKFKAEMLRLGADSNLMDYFTYDENGEVLMPAYINSALRKLESVAQSLFNNNITRQKLPGFHAAQVTNVGWRKLSDTLTDALYATDLEYHPTQWRKRNDENSKPIPNREYQKLSDEEKKEYKDVGPGNYIEVMLPKGNFGIDMNSEHYRNMTDEEILKELQAKGLDTLIGYRIPTEGKQSMCVMKVVGFTDDAYGSTIVVPNDWVSQTGSDFDIDSVYGVQFPTTRRKNGEIIKITYTERPTVGEWLAYLNKNTDEDDENLKEELSTKPKEQAKKESERRKALRKELDSEFNRLQREESQLFADLPKKMKEKIRDSDSVINDEHEQEIEEGKNKKAIYEERLKGYIEVYNNIKSKNRKTYNQNKEIIEAYKTCIDNIQNHLDTVEGKIPPKTDFYRQHEEALNNLAREAGLMTYVEYIDSFSYDPENNDLRRVTSNSKRQRQSRICQLMIDILSNDTSIEENLSRSNFDDVIYWRDELMNINDANRRKFRTAYNIFDQIAYQQDATSGLALKGLSVSLDTFCSVCNTVRPRLATPITIIYDSADFGQENSKYGETPEEVCNRFGCRYKKAKDGGFIIEHDKYGWSHEDGTADKNVAGKILTSYSSQTTAHILDAIKEGAIPGVNTFTFPAYKTLLNIGSDYKTAISFIMQPAVRLILAKYEETNSVFSGNFGRPINKAIREVAKRLGRNFSVATPTNAIIESLNADFGDRLNEIFGWNTDDGATIKLSLNTNDASTLAINTRLQADRLKNRGIFADTTPVEWSDKESGKTRQDKEDKKKDKEGKKKKGLSIDMAAAPKTQGELNRILFDLGTIVIFNRLNNIATDIGKVARCCNPDKFGAKQTVFATNRTFEDIRDIVNTTSASLASDTETSEIGQKKRKKAVLVANKNGQDVHILEAIYPGIFEGTEEDPIAGMRKYTHRDSSYPTLFNFLKYASGSSILINRAIFDTQNINFVSIVNGLASKLSGTNKRLDEATYNSMQEYLLTRLYDKVDFLAYPVSIVYDDDKTASAPRFKIDTPNKTDNFLSVDDERTRLLERNRISGFGYDPGINVIVTREATKEELEKEPTKKVIRESVPFTVKSIHRPTNEEIAQFATLSPAQKIQWIQENTEDAGVFSLVDVSLYNPSTRGKYANTQTIEYRENTVSPEVGYYLFNKAFYDNNPLYQLAAIDMIKYAFLVEGAKMKVTGVLKLIPNVPIYTTRNADAETPGGTSVDGTGITEELESIMDRVKRAQGEFANDAGPNSLRDKIHEDYIRSHIDTVGIRTIYATKAETDPNSDFGINAHKTNYGFTIPINIKRPIHLPGPNIKPNPTNDPDIDDENEEARIEYLTVLAESGIAVDPDESLPDPVTHVKKKFNNYIKVQIGNGRDREIRLYKIKSLGDGGVILYPINLLEPFEHGTWSAKEENNVVPQPAYYEAVISEYLNNNDYNKNRLTGNVFDTITSNLEKNNPDIKENIYKKAKKVSGGVKANPSLNIEKLAAEGSTDAKAILEYAYRMGTDISAKPAVFRSALLTNYIYTPGIEYGSVQTIKIGNTTRKFIIERIDGAAYSNLLKRSEETIRKAEIDDALKDILIDLKQRNWRISNVFRMVPVADSSITSTIEDKASPSKKAFESIQFDETTVDTVRLLASSSRRDENAYNSISTLRAIGVNPRDEKTILAHKVEAYREIADWSTKLINQIVTLYDMFVQDADGNYHKITDDYIIDILNSKIPGTEEHRRTIENLYLTWMNTARMLVDKLAGYNSINTIDEDDDVKFYVNKIKESLKPLLELDIDEVSHRYNELYLSKLSTNPTVKSGLMKIMDNYYKTNGSMWMFNDVLESANPLLQTIMKDVMGDIESKRQQTIFTKNKFRRRIAEIKKAAAAAGVNIDWNKIIDEYGVLTQKYIPNLMEDLKRLRNNRDNAAIKYGRGSLEHLKAELEYDKFKTTYFHQEANQQYYIDRNKIVSELLQENNAAREAYVLYKELEYRRRNITRYKKPSEYTEEDRKELNNIDKWMFYVRVPADNISGFPIHNGQKYHNSSFDVIYNRIKAYRERHPDSSSYTIDDIINIDNGARDERTSYLKDVRQLVFDVRISEYLDTKLKLLNTLEDTYFEYEGKALFDEQLNKNLEIIDRAEKRVNGRITASSLELEQNDAYQRARQWLAENAKFEIYNKDKDNEGSLGKLVHDALTRMMFRGNGKPDLNLSKSLENKLKEVTDEFGNVDVSKLTDAEFDEYKRKIKTFYHNREIKGFIIPLDTLLISSVTPPLDDNGKPVKYTKEFYRNVFPLGTAQRSGEYYELITKINAILVKYYDKASGVINFPVVHDGDADYYDVVNELKTLGTLYKKLRALQRADSVKVNTKFLEEKVDTSIDRQLFVQQLDRIGTKTGDDERQFHVDDIYKKALFSVILDYDENDNVIIQNGLAKPNPRIFGRFELKNIDDALHGGIDSRFIDSQLSEDIDLINDVYTTQPTRYWYEAEAKAIARHRQDPSFDLNEWTRSNYYYNPKTGNFELLPIWTERRVKPEFYSDGTFVDRWVPKGKQRIRKVKDGSKMSNGRLIQDPTKDMRDEDYIPDVGLERNYIVGANNGMYDSNVEMNQYEKDIHTEITKLLMSTARTDEAVRYFSKGYMPTKRKVKTNKHEKLIRQVLGRFIPESGEEMNEIIKDVKANKDKIIKFKTDSEVQYASDYDLSIPMAGLIIDAEAGSIEFNEPEPKLISYPDTIAGREQYQNDHAIWKQQKDEVTAKNKEVNKALIERDWEVVLDEYIDRIGHYNAVIANKERMYYLLDCLEKQEAYMRQHGYYGDLSRRGKDGPYIKTRDENLIKHYKDFLKRILFDQWKEDTGVMTTLGKHLQSYASANYMMLNLRSGVANVTLGSWGMIAEAAAGSYMKMKDLRAGTIEWRKGSIGIARKIYDPDSVNVQDAIIKFFKVVDYDEITGVPEKLTYETWIKRVKNSMYLPQTIGEHFMQNSVLFAMLKSHKLVTIPEDSKGVNTTFMNEEEYIRYRENQDFEQLLSDEQRQSYKSFLDSIADDPNIAKDYIYFRKDSLTEWLNFHCPADIRDKFYEDRKENKQKYKEEFAKLDNMFDQLELGEDGYLAFREGSTLAKLNTEILEYGNEVTKAVYITGMFSERVKSVNRKIHGVYNKLGRAYIEHHWLGGLIMQYHKHLPMGILKRWRIQGYYNETRGSVEKGMAQTLWDCFINPYSLNNRIVQNKLGFTADESGAVQALFFHVRHTLDYILQIKNTYDILPDYEKGNVWRNLCELGAVGSGVLFTFALLMLAGGDDDKNDGIGYNFLLYEADRLASEAFLYNPIGIYNEGKVLMSTPIAAQSIISDLFKACTNIIKAIFGDEEDLYYKSGRFAKRSKLSVYIERRIPIWYGIRGVIETPENNHYYKIGSTGLKPTAPARWLAEGILGKD